MAYDKYCPTVKPKVPSRTYSKCGKYFALLSMLKTYSKVHKVVPVIIKFTPKNVIAKRADESLVVYNSYDDEDEVEWMPRVDKRQRTR